MSFIIISLRSRTQVMKFYELAKREGLNCGIINTPREASVGCGLSVKIGEDSLPRARRILNSYALDTFIGIFRVTDTGRGLSVERL